MTKVCPACLSELPMAAFNKNTATTDNLRTRCRECDKLRRPSLIKKKRVADPNLASFNIRRRKACNKYEKTARGFLMRTYRNMQSRVQGVQKKSLHLYAGLSLLDRKTFYSRSLKNTEFNYLFEVWKKLDYNIRHTPSIDRIDASKGYIEGNIRWITHSQNSRETRRWQSSLQMCTTTSKLLT